MLWCMALVAVLAMTIGLPAVSQDQPPSSAEAKRIEALVNKAAAIVDAKGKAALSDFREKGSEWFSGELYVFAYAPDGTVLLNPAFPAREGRSYQGEKNKSGKAFHDGGWRRRTALDGSPTGCPSRGRLSHRTSGAASRL